MTQVENQFAVMETNLKGQPKRLISTHSSYNAAVVASIRYYRPNTTIKRRRKVR